MTCMNIDAECRSVVSALFGRWSEHLFPSQLREFSWKVEFFREPSSSFDASLHVFHRGFLTTSNFFVLFL